MNIFTLRADPRELAPHTRPSSLTLCHYNLCNPFRYPPLRLTLTSLSKIYRCMDALTFQGLAQGAIGMCTEQLQKAARRIGKRSGAGEVHALLFLVRHLLILREQIQAFRDINFR